MVGILGIAGEGGVTGVVVGGFGMLSCGIDGVTAVVGTAMVEQSGRSGFSIGGQESGWPHLPEPL